MSESSAEEDGMAFGHLLATYPPSLAVTRAPWAGLDRPQLGDELRFAYRAGHVANVRQHVIDALTPMQVTPLAAIGDEPMKVYGGPRCGRLQFPDAGRPAH